MRVYTCGCTEYREDETAAMRPDGADLLVECHGPCPAHRPAPVTYAAVRLFTPAPAVMPGQIGLDVGDMADRPQRCAFCETVQPCEWWAEGDWPGSWVCIDEDACQARAQS